MNENFIKDLAEKMKLLWRNILNKRKIKYKKAKEKKEIEEKNKHYKKQTLNKINYNLLYPKITLEEKKLLNTKCLNLKNKIFVLKQENNNLNINTINEIINSINNNEIHTNQYVNINKLLDNINNNEELKLNTNEKLEILKDNISTIIDKKLNDYEEYVLEKAYQEYNQVNYVIMTTLLINDILQEIKEVNDDYNKNKYSKIEYEQKIKKIKNKINNLKTINNRKEVREELENLQQDFFTKKNDKYNLLYNDSIFDNLEDECDKLIKNIEYKEKLEKKKEENDKIEKEEIKLALNKKNKVLKEKEEKEKQKEQKEKKEKEYENNLLKRFIDQEIAKKILLLRETSRNVINTKDSVIRETINFYNNFLEGDNHEFNFEKNRLKTEIVLLYNDINHNISFIEKTDYLPLNSINIDVNSLAYATLQKQKTLNNLIEKKYSVNIDKDESSKAVKDKLTQAINKEEKHNDKAKKDNKEKVLKKEFKTNNETKEKNA